jgi:hypothetical protein
VHSSIARAALFQLQKRGGRPTRVVYWRPLHLIPLNGRRSLCLSPAFCFPQTLPPRSRGGCYELWAHTNSIIRPAEGWKPQGGAGVTLLAVGGKCVCTLTANSWARFSSGGGAPLGLQLKIWSGMGVGKYSDFSGNI